MTKFNAEIVVIVLIGLLFSNTFFNFNNFISILRCLIDLSNISSKTG